MSSFSLSSICASPSPSGNQPRTDGGKGSRPSTPRIRTNTSQFCRHPRPPSSPASGSRVRIFDWDQQESLPSSSTRPGFSPRSPIAGESGHAPRGIAPQTPPSYSKVRSRASAGSSCNEVSPVFRVSGLGRRVLGFQAHQSEHAYPDRATRVSSLVLAQAPAESLNQAPSLSSSLTSAPSFAAPPTPQSQASPVRLHGYRHSAFVTPSPSSSSLRSDARPCELAQALYAPSTPSPSPRSHAQRSSQPAPRSSPLVPTHTFTIRRGLVPPRARPTLAMSLQVHAPTPVMSTRPMSPPLPSNTRPRSRSRPPSSSRPCSPLAPSAPLPSRPPMTRPPSRSERLLRDTLRRAEEQDRIAKSASPSFTLSPPPPTSNLPPAVVDMFATCRLPAAADGGRRHRRNTSSSMQSDSSCDYFEGQVLDEDSHEEEEDAAWLWRANSAGSISSMSSGHGYGHAYYPSRPSPASKADSVPYGTPAPPSPARAQLQRAAKSSPTVPRRHSHSQSVSHVAGHPHSRTSADGEHPAWSCHQPGAPLTPHEAVLRSKLEGVLKSAASGGSRTRSTERRDAEPGLSSGSGNSMASSRNLSGEGDFFFGASSDPSLTSLSSNDSKAAPVAKPKASVPSSPRRAHVNLHMPPPPLSSRPTQRHPSSPGTQKGGVSPLTPPPSPPFNARQAADQIKGMDGYISFANIQGLGIPEGTDDESEEDAKSRSRWFQWLHLTSGGKGPAVSDRSRGRSESASSASR
ncbi:hypothetical protein BV20DRAFT_472011 [Pilatotrama ljubarskyi]|nr:hypothetical protein BV20DRAFT_472011 [Pilatotrama ljubarskyi]